MRSVKGVAMGDDYSGKLTRQVNDLALLKITSSHWRAAGCITRLICSRYVARAMSVSRREIVTFALTSNAPQLMRCWWWSFGG